MSERTEPEKANELLRVNDVASMCGVSVRHIYRLSVAGQMPKPMKLGGATRWRRPELEQWIAAGCPKRWGMKGGVA